MNMLKVIASVFVAVLALFFSQLSYAGNDGKIYIGGTLGQVKALKYCVGVRDPITCDDTNQVLGVFVGLQSNRYFGIEIGYVDFGKFEIHGNGTALGIFCYTCTGTYTYSDTIRIKGFRFASIGSIPVGKDFFVLGKLGFLHWSANEESIVTGSGFPPGIIDLYPTTGSPGERPFISYSKKDSGNTPLLGVGLKYEINEQFALRFDAEMALRAYSKYDYRIYNSSIIYKF